LNFGPFAAGEGSSPVPVELEISELSSPAELTAFGRSHRVSFVFTL
jgi:hypothetical protein